MAPGKKTGAVGVGALLAAPFDPTGISLVVGVGSVTVGAARWVRGKMKSPKPVMAPGGLLTSADIARLRQIVRALTSSTIGLTTSSALSLALPYHLVPATINAGVLIHYIRELRHLAAKVGSKRTLLSYIRTHQLVADVLVATAMKVVFLVLCVGHDFDVLASTLSNSEELVLGHLETGTTPDLSLLPESEAAEWHAAFSEHGILPLTHGVMDALPSGVQEALIGGDADANPAIWGSDAAHQLGAGGMLLIGSAIAGMDQAARIAMEQPADDLVQRIEAR